MMVSDSEQSLPLEVRMRRGFLQSALVWILLPSFLLAQQVPATHSRTDAAAPQSGSTAVAPPPAAQVKPGTSSAASPEAATSAPPPPGTLLDGTPLKLRLTQTITSHDAKVGEEVPFEVIEDVAVDGVPVIAKGATAMGTVTEALPARRMGRAGKLNINISYVRLRDNEKAMLRAVKDAQGKGHVGAMTGAIVATSIVFFPAAPLFLFMHGKNITIPQGTVITAFVQGDMHLDMARFEGASTAGVPATLAVASAPASCSLIVASTPPGADIDIDGAFVGNTPSTVTVSAGSHEVVVKKQGYSDWSRKLSVTGGSVRLEATLTAVAGS